MARVTVSHEAGRELRDRIPGLGGADGIMIVPGPAHEHYSGVEWTAEDETIAPIQRWLLLPVPVSSFQPLLRAYPNEFGLAELEGFEVCVFLPPQETLHLELQGEAIRVREIHDA